MGIVLIKILDEIVDSLPQKELDSLAAESHLTQCHSSCDFPPVIAMFCRKQKGWEIVAQP